MRRLKEFNSKETTLGEILSPSRWLLIPSYQREYSWTDQHVEALFRDSVSTLPEGGNWIDSIIASPSQGGRELIVVDGQQRLTTSFILLAAARDRIRELDPESADQAALIDEILYHPYSSGVNDFRIRSQHTLANWAIEMIALGYGGNLLPPLQQPAAQYAGAYQLLSTLLREQFGDDANAVSEFTDQFLSRTLATLTQASYDDAVEIYLRTNDRGSDLSELDKLKARIYNSCERTQRDEFVGLFHDVLEQVWASNEHPDRVLLHIATAAVLRSKSTLRPALEQVSKRAVADPVKVVQDLLLPAASAYTRVTNGQRPDGSPCPPLQEILSISRLRRFRGFRPVLVAAALAGVDNETFDRLAREIADALFVLSISGSSPPENEEEFFRWSRAMREDGVNATLHAIEAKRNAHSKAFASHFVALRYQDLGDRGVRFLLGRIEQYVRKTAGYTDASVSGSALDVFGQDYDVEHILPRSYDQWTDFSNPAEYVERLGNLAMLERTRNRSLKNDTFGVKREDFALSNSLVTKSIYGSIAGAGQANAAAQAAELLQAFSTWDPQAVESRNALLYQLAAATFGLTVEATVESVQDDSERRAHEFFTQGRPENTLRALERLLSGPSQKETLATNLVGKQSRGVSERNVSYALETLQAFQLAEPDVDETWTLTDFGQEVAAMSPEDRGMALRRVFEQNVLRAPALAAILRAPAAQRVEVALLHFPQFTESTVGHRVAALAAWDNDLPPL